MQLERLPVSLTARMRVHSQDRVCMPDCVMNENEEAESRNLQSLAILSSGSLPPQKRQGNGGLPLSVKHREMFYGIVSDCSSGYPQEGMVIFTFLDLDIE